MVFPAVKHATKMEPPPWPERCGGAPLSFLTAQSRRPLTGNLLIGQPLPQPGGTLHQEHATLDIRSALDDNMYASVAPLSVRQGPARPRRRRASMPEILYSAMRPTVEPMVPPPLPARPIIDPSSPSQLRRATSSPPFRSPRNIAAEVLQSRLAEGQLLSTPEMQTLREASGLADTNLMQAPRPPLAAHRRRASKISFPIPSAAAEEEPSEARGSGRQWARVRALLWRILDPAAAFPHLVRRALSVHRACVLLWQQPALAAIGKAELVAMVCAASEERMPRYTQLYREASNARSLFVLLEGVIEHTASCGVPQGQRVQRCDSGSHEGAAGAWSMRAVVVGPEALSRVPRASTTTALSECLLLRISPHLLSPGAVARELVRQQLPGVPLFSGLPPEALADLAALVGTIEVREGKDVLPVGAVPPYFCILTHGSVAVLMNSGLCAARIALCVCACVRIGRVCTQLALGMTRSLRACACQAHVARCVARLNARPADATLRNPFFGEMGLLANKPAMASVRATSYVRCLTISRTNFARFLSLVPDFEERVTEIGRARGRVNALKVQLDEANAARAFMVSASKAMEVLALPSMQWRERRCAGEEAPDRGLAGDAFALLESKKQQLRARRPPKGTL